MSPGLTVFILFFGVALIDAVRGGDWLRVLFWLAMGVTFWLLDQRRLRLRG
jgi:hypothetical protein